MQPLQAVRRGGKGTLSKERLTTAPSCVTKRGKCKLAQGWAAAVAAAAVAAALLPVCRCTCHELVGVVREFEIQRLES